jgi:hypothetical protein
MPQFHAPVNKWENAEPPRPAVAPQALTPLRPHGSYGGMSCAFPPYNSFLLIKQRLGGAGFQPVRTPEGGCPTQIFRNSPSWALSPPANYEKY